MNKDKVIDALGKIGDDMVEETGKLRTKGEKATLGANRKKEKMGVNRKKKWQRRLAMAACFILVCGAAIAAEATAGTASNLLAPLFGGAQTEIVDSIGIPEGASVSADGYTMTVDAIIGDRYHMAVVYTLTRDDGQPIPEDVGFEDWYAETNLRFLGGSGSQTFSRVEDEDDPGRVHFIHTWSRELPLIGRHVTAYFANLSVYNKESEDTLLAEGPWELKYTLRYPDSTVELPVKALKVTDEFGKEYSVNEILLSPVGIHMDVTVLDVVWGETYIDIKVSLVLKDGTTLPLAGGGSLSYAKGDETADGDYRAMFESPISLEDIEALIIGDTTYPVNLQ